MKNKRKLYKGILSFSKAEMMGYASINHAGMAIGRPAADEAAKKVLMESFGLFGGSSDANKYYPDVTGHSVMPKPEDFVDVPFRLISATTVGAGSWKATDFSNVQVLKGSLSKLDKKPVYYDHDTDLMNWVGIVKAPKWTESFTNKDGVIVPAGIDAIISIDAKTSPKIARGVLIGSVFSNSVTVQFAWEMSHDFPSEEEFNRSIGQMGADGKMVRRIVHTIYDYHETSLVWLGADPFAKLLDEEGNLTNIDTTHISYEKEKEEVIEKYKNKKIFALGFEIDKNVLHLSRSNSIVTQPNSGKNDKNNKDMDEKVLLALLAVLGLSADTKAEAITLEAVSKLTLQPEQPKEAITEEQKTQLASYAKIQALEVEAKEGVTATLADVTTEKYAIVDKEVLSTLKTEAAKVESLEKDAATGKEFIKMQREEAIRLYKVTAGEAADETVVGLFNKATKEELGGLLKQYSKGATAKFTGKCANCGSDDFTFKSSLTTEEGTEEGEKVGVTTAADIYAKFSKTSMDITNK